MTIRTGIEPGAILWKHIENRQVQRWDANRNAYYMEEHPQYYVIKLVTRRARTQGHTVRKELKPFFDALRIKMIEARVWRDGRSEQWYTAVGTENVRIRDKETWDAITIDETASRWYQRLTNQTLTSLLDRRGEQFGDEIIEEMKAAITDDTSEIEEWPAEPRLQEYSLNVSDNYYRGHIRW